MSDRWEYHIITLGSDIWGRTDERKLTKSMNNLGRQGWELVGFNANALTDTPMAVFKHKGS